MGKIGNLLAHIPIIWSLAAQDVAFSTVTTQDFASVASFFSCHP
jgi:hypothetical protein